MNTFRTHTGEIVTGDRLAVACAKVADDWADLGRAIRAADNYAPHVTEAKKDFDLARMLNAADAIRQGEINSFTIWQRVNTAVTGECVALLGKESLS